MSLDFDSLKQLVDIGMGAMALLFYRKLSASCAQQSKVLTDLATLVTEHDQRIAALEHNTALQSRVRARKKVR